MECIISNEYLSPQHVKRSALTVAGAEEQQRSRPAYAVEHPEEERQYRLYEMVAMPATHHAAGWPEDSSSRPSPLAAWLEALDKAIARFFIGTLKTTLADAYHKLDIANRPSTMRFTLHRRSNVYRNLLDNLGRPSASGIRHGGERACQGGLVPEVEPSPRKRWLGDYNLSRLQKSEQTSGPSKPIVRPIVYVWQGDIACHRSYRHVD